MLSAHTGIWCSFNQQLQLQKPPRAKLFEKYSNSPAQGGIPLPAIPCRWGLLSPVDGDQDHDHVSRSHSLYYRPLMIRDYTRRPSVYFFGHPRSGSIWRSNVHPGVNAPGAWRPGCLSPVLLILTQGYQRNLRPMSISWKVSPSSFVHVTAPALSPLPVLRKEQLVGASSPQV